MQTAAIVGVGLIGGSFALALRKAGFEGRILGVSSPGVLQQALELGVIDEGLPLEEAAGRADLVYLSQPIDGILETLERIDSAVRRGTLITDAGSTKLAIVAKAKKCIYKGQFLGGHPMAGRETRGVSSADADLFAGRTYIVTPVDARDLETEMAREFVAWIDKIGAIPVSVSAEDHDRSVAFTSHLPQLLSTALAAALSEQSGLDQMSRLAGPGLRDLTRLALSSYDLWGPIFETNADAVEQALSVYIAKLESFRGQLASERMREEFRVASEFATELRRRSGG